MAFRKSRFPVVRTGFDPERTLCHSNFVRETVTGASMLAITLPTNGLRLFGLESTCFNEPLPHDHQKAVGFSHISVALF
jgi:hypothetical protein